MNKKELINAVATVGGMSKKDAQNSIDLVIETIMTELSEGNSVNLAGFGNFSVTNVEKRKGRNPLTGEEITIPAHKKPVFKFSQTFKKSFR